MKKSIAIIRDAASGLAAAHALGIIHRDLKPENILLMEAAGRPDFVKLVDFGVAKLPVDVDADPAEQHLTMRGTVVGTPGYIAPEVALKDITNDPRSDLYALGVVWFECLAGRAPYSARTATGLLMMHATEPVPALPPEIPLPVAGLVQRLLAKNPDDRPATAEQLVDALDALPSFDSNAAVPRPTQVMHLADPSAATLEDSGRRAPGGPPLAGSLSTEGYAPHAQATTAVDLPPDAQTMTSVATPSLPPRAPSSPSATSPRTRAPLVVGVAVAALVGAGGAFIGARSFATSGAVDAGAVSGAVDAGAASGAMSGAVDAGAVLGAVDAGATSGAVDAGPKKRRVKPRGPGEGSGGEHVPDLD